MARPKKVVESQEKVADVQETVVEQPVQVEEVKVTKEEPKKETEEKKSLSIELKASPTEKELNRAKLQKLIDEETKMVKGRFRCVETPGGSQRIQVRKYPGIPMFDKVMKDGEKYEIPLYVARHLNGIDAVASAIGGKIGTCSYPVHGFKWNPLEAMPQAAMGSGPSGEPGVPVPIAGITKRVRRYAFESAEFEV